MAKQSHQVRSVVRRLSLLALGATLLMGVTAGVWRDVAADVTGPTSQDKRVTIVVNQLMESQHLLKHPLDDEISQRAMKSYIETLDPMKLFFYRSDIDEFMKKENDLDNELQQNNTGFAYFVFHTFIKRLDQRTGTETETGWKKGWVDETLESDIDFKAEEFMTTDFEKLDYAATEKEARERWRKRIKYDLIVLQNDDKTPKEAKERIHRRYKNLNRRWRQLSNDDLLEMYLTAVTTSYDPHTTYMSASTLENFRIALGLRLEGIGAQLKDEDGTTEVTKVIRGGAADKHGMLKEGDQIVSVGQGEDGEMVDVVNMRLNDVVKMIRGQAGTVVRLGVVSSGGGEQKVLKITRAKVELADSAAKGKVFEAGSQDGKPFRIGVIDLPSFYMDMEGARNNERNYKSTTVDVRRILEDFKTKGVDAVVLDLRQNGGGSLTEAINLTGLFIDEGPVVQVKSPDNSVRSLSDLDPGMAWSGPLVVMTSKLSASASEILAGAIQDYNRGLIVGDETTHGKGTVQSLLDLSEYLGFRRPLGALKITQQQFYRPNGDSTQVRGVLADVVLPSVTTHMDVAESDLDYAVKFDRVNKARFRPYKMVSGDTLTLVRNLSQKRRKDDEDFSKLNSKILKYIEQKGKKRVTLNAEQFAAEREEFDADKEDDKQFEDQANPDDSIERDFYLDEILNITVDYIKELKKLDLARAR